jgi:urea transport system ATP-binding protein
MTVVSSTGIEGTGGGSSSLGHVAEPGKIDVSHRAILYLEGVTVSFDGFKALNDLSFSIDAGELRCVIGPNGAGKTTMMDVITGKTRPDAGTVFLGQTIDLTQQTEYEIARLGVGRKFQKPSVFENHTVFENLELAIKGSKGVWDTLLQKRDSAQEDRIREMLTRIHLAARMNEPAGRLSHGQKQWLEIGMLLMQDPQILLLDEPAAGMSDDETARTAELFLSLEGKHSLVVVEHDMEFVASLARKVTVLHEGHVLAEGSMDKVQNDERVIEVYLGR